MQQIDSILAVAGQYDAVVFDQWGVLHDGTAPYPHAVAAIDALKDRQLAVLSNSGKRAGPNKARITDMGFAQGAFDVVMTSGEALYRDISKKQLGDIHTVYPITAKAGDAQRWADGLSLDFSDDLGLVDAILLMGLTDSKTHPIQRAVLEQARRQNIPLICSNPDRASPRAGGETVEAPGALAHAYADAGGPVTFYGKPHKPIFDALFAALGTTRPDKVLMVGDSPEHDIAGASAAGWHSLFIAGGLHADAAGDLFTDGIRPTYTLPTLR